MAKIEGKLAYFLLQAEAQSSDLSDLVDIVINDLIAWKNEGLSIDKKHEPLISVQVLMLKLMSDEMSISEIVQRANKMEAIHNLMGDDKIQSN